MEAFEDKSNYGINNFIALAALQKCCLDRNSMAGDREV